MGTITKKELVNRIAEKTGQTKVITKDVIQMFLDEIINELGKGNRLEFREFGVFEIKERAARKAQNPRTLEKVSVPAKKVVKFKVGRLMKELVGITTPRAPRASASGGGAPRVEGGGSPAPASSPRPPSPGGGDGADGGEEE
ncbi:MAG: integration host factor subunit beta [Planctomycetes bacterium]|nr:integration host factor subunit beta [Planctomycetota bacterium]